MIEAYTTTAKLSKPGRRPPESTYLKALRD